MTTEWPATLDVDALIAEGWRPTPFREFCLKIHSRCDLACDYCYMYEMADQSWRGRPAVMSRGTIDDTARRIAEHVRTHRLPAVRIVLHGGEPLLAGAERLEYAVTAVRAAVRAAGTGCEVEAGIQTNGVRLDETFLRLFTDLGVGVGISLDGVAADHDRHRRRRNGRGSHAEVLAALDRLTGERYRPLFSGILCTIDLRNDPLATYQALGEWRPPAIDFLLPHGNWSTPPPGRPPGTGTPYADWLIPIFDRWYRSPAPQPQVRLFGQILRLLLGAASTSESIGLSPMGLLFIETDGTIEQADTLKSSYQGAPATGFRVADDTFDSVLALPSMAAQQLGERALAAECRSCRVRRVCGGGLYAHRYRAGSGFANPSVYCADLLRLIDHIRDTVQSDLAARREADLREAHLRERAT